MTRYDFPRFTVPANTQPPLIGIPELGGGYYPNDFALAAQAIGAPTPDVSFVGVLGATNSPPITMMEK